MEVIQPEHWWACSTQLGCCTKTTRSRSVPNSAVNRCWGLLKIPGLPPQVEFAYELFVKRDPLCAKFKKTFSQDVKVEFMGMW